MSTNDSAAMSRSMRIELAYERLVAANVAIADTETAVVASEALNVLPSLAPADQARVLVALLAVAILYQGPLSSAALDVLEAAAR